MDHRPRHPSRARFWAAPLSIAIVSPAALAATDLHFDYTSFETGFNQSHFDVLNYPAINGNYMMTSTDNHRPEMVANNNQLAQFYNWLTDRYTEQAIKNGAAAADVINQYAVDNSTNNGPRPTWLVLNEISPSLWSANPGPPGVSTYRTWLMDCVTRLSDHYGYDVVTLAPFQNPAQNNASWQALSAVSYVGVECYLSGTEVMNSGSTDAQRLAWATSQYLASKNSYLARGVPDDRIFVIEHFANNAATQDNGNPTGWGRAGLASAEDWDRVIKMRQDAIRAVGFDGFLAYNWGGNAMGVTQAEQLQHEYHYRSRLVMAGQQPQWLSDAAINVNGTTIPLAWDQPLNWLGGVPDGVGAVANFYRTNTAARSVPVNGSRTLGTLTFHSASPYSITPGTGGAMNTLTMDNTTGSANIAVTLGSHVILPRVAFADDTTITLSPAAAKLTITGDAAAIAGADVTKAGAGTLEMKHLRAPAAALNVNAGRLTILSNGAATGVSDLGAIAVAAGATLDLKNNSLIVRGGAPGSWNGSAYTGIAGLIDAGRANGTWTGTGGIVTTSAAPADLTTLGIATAGSLQASAFAGLSLAANDVLVRFTWGGDANLDGKIDIDDYGQIDFNVAIPGASGWFGGDFNYDGKINIDDYGIIDFSVAAQAQVLPGGSVSKAAAAVPEPATLALLALTPLIRRRRTSGRGCAVPSD